MKTSACAIFGSVLLTFGAIPTSAGIIYDNSLNYRDAVYYPGNGSEVGDEIFLSGGPNISFNEFAFETFVGANASGNESVRIRFLLNDGPEVSPGAFAPQTQLYDSGDIPLGSDFQTTTISGINVTLPPGVNHFTWTADFSGVDAGEQAGLPIYHPPTVGDSYTDFWRMVNGAWETALLPETPASFAARISSVGTVPDTGPTALLGLIAAAAMFVLRRRLDIVE